MKPIQNPSADFIYLFIYLLVCLLAAVNNDILWLDPLFEHAHLGVFATSTKQTWRLNFEVADTLLMMVQQTEAKLIHNLLVGILDHLK